MGKRTSHKYGIAYFQVVEFNEGVSFRLEKAGLARRRKVGGFFIGDSILIDNQIPTGDYGFKSGSADKEAAKRIFKLGIASPTKQSR